MSFTLEEVLPALRAVLARQLVTRHGLTGRETAQVLGLTPAAVTQYLRGKRAEAAVRRIEQAPDLLVVVAQLLDELLQRHRHGEQIDVQTFLLDGAHKLLTVSRGQALATSSAAPERISFRVSRDQQQSMIDLLRRRMAAEQSAARRSMEFALWARNDLSKILFRQIASDSLRHADIVGALITYLEKGGNGPRAEPPDTREIETMLREEESADEAEIDMVRHLRDPHVRLLLDSIEADERKHTALLRGFLKAATRR